MSAQKRFEDAIKLLGMTGMSQSEIAREAELSVSYVSQIMGGGGRLTNRTFRKISILMDKTSRIIRGRAVRVTSDNYADALDALADALEQEAQELKQGLGRF